MLDRTYVVAAHSRATIWINVEEAALAGSAFAASFLLLFGLLREHLRLAKGGAAFDKPVYDLVTHTRMPEVERIVHADWVIVEGIHLLAAPDLRDLFDLSVFMHSDEALRLGRRVIRDVEQRGRTPRSVMAQFFTHVRAMHEAHVEPQRALADLVIVCPYDAGPGHADASAAQIAERLT